MEEIIIRKALTTDIETLLRFEQGVITAEKPYDITIQDPPVRYYDLDIMFTSPDIELVVATINGELIGCGYARIENARLYLKHKQHAYLGFMYVEPHHRGKGVNQKIIETLKQWALSRNITEMRLDVYYGNDFAIKAYEKVGFERHLIEMRLGI